jgi:hypothetical protein
VESDFIALATGPGAALVLLVTAFVAGWRRWWVFGWQYKDKEREAIEWKEAALRALSGAESAAQIGEQLVQATKEGYNVRAK